MEKTILHINGLSKAFVRSIRTARRREAVERVRILNGLNLEVKAGQITALIGGNGSGKTTLFNIINGFLDADKGSIRFINGSEHELLGKKPDAIARLGLGRLFQDNHTFDELTVLENMLVADNVTFGETPFVSLFAPHKNRRVEQAKTEEAKEIFENVLGADPVFWRKKDDKAKNLSHGQRRLLGLCRIFMGDYKLVLLDEPTAGVNRELFDSIHKILNRMMNEKNMSVFLIEHNMGFVKQVAQQCLFIHDGAIHTSGTPAEVIDDPLVQKTYLGL